MTILNIDTSGFICSVSLGIDGRPVHVLTSHQEVNHASVLPLYIQEMLDKAEELEKTLDAVAVAGGPGSYTGLRIGVSTAKGLCYGLGIKLIAIDTTEIIAFSIASNIRKAFSSTASANQSLPILACPMIDARRMEVYTANYELSDVQNLILERKGKIEAKIINSDSFAEELKTHHIYFAGNGSEKCKSVITHPNAHFAEGSSNAEFMCELSERHYVNAVNGEEGFADIAYYTPFYLKDYIAAQSHVKGLH